MKWLIGTLVLLFAITVVAQQQNMPSNDFSNQPATMSNSAVTYDLQSTFATAPEFNSTQVLATVSDDSVILSGFVNSEGQRDSALSLASQYAGDRQIVDQIQVGGLTGGGY